jgi:hypothetical protein
MPIACMNRQRITMTGNCSFVVGQGEIGDPNILALVECLNTCIEVRGWLT